MRESAQAFDEPDVQLGEIEPSIGEGEHLSGTLALPHVARAIVIVAAIMEDAAQSGQTRIQAARVLLDAAYRLPAKRLKAGLAKVASVKAATTAVSIARASELMQLLARAKATPPGDGSGSQGVG